MKTVFRASVIATLLAASVAFAGEWPPKLPVRGTEGPEMRATPSAPLTQSARRADSLRIR